MKKIIITVLICIITITSIWLYFHHKYCKYDWNEVHSLNYTRPINELKGLVTEKNDKEAYGELQTAYLNELYYPGEYVFYSLLMANKCHTQRAYYRVFYELRNAEILLGEDFYDKETRTFMLDYLKKGATLGDRLCIKELGELYIEGKYVPKDTKLGKKLMGSIGFKSQNKSILLHENQK